MGKRWSVFFGISMPAFRIAGGIILFILGLDMVRDDFTTMFALGDSTTDTGNAIHSPQRAVFQLAAEPPYGSSYFARPTGRFSDGRLMLDLLAQALHRDLLPPHLGLSSNLSHGSQNFAVAGATAWYVWRRSMLGTIVTGMAVMLPLRIGLGW